MIHGLILNFLYNKASVQYSNSCLKSIARANEISFGSGVWKDTMLCIMSLPKVMSLIIEHYVCKSNMSLLLCNKLISRFSDIKTSFLWKRLLSTTMDSNTEKCRYCSSQSASSTSNVWIRCDACDAWYHAHCLGLDAKECDRIEQYHCPECTTSHGPSTCNMTWLLILLVLLFTIVYLSR